jgi:hypothetical protein
MRWHCQQTRERTFVRIGGWLISIALTVAMAGCDRAATTIAGIRTDLPNPTVPGGVAVVAAADSPAVCAELASSQASRTLSQAFSQMAASDTTPLGGAQVREAAAEFRAVARGAGDPLRGALNETAAGLDRLAEHGLNEPAVTTTLSQHLTRLGTTAQATCRFPTGTPDAADAPLPTPSAPLPASTAVLNAALPVGSTEVSAHAGPAPGLCNVDYSRGRVPDRFAIDGCVDGASIWLRNSLDIPVRITTSGDVRSSVTTQASRALAALATRAIYRDPTLMLPGDVMRLRLGLKAASATVTDTNAAGFFTLAMTLAPLVPGSKVTNIQSAFTTFVKYVADAYTAYRSCLLGRNGIGQLGCNLQLAKDVTSAAGLPAVQVVLAASRARWAVVADLLLSAIGIVKFLQARAESIHRLHTSDRTVTQSAATGGPVGTILAEGTALRAGPATTTELLDRLRTGTTATVLCYSTGETVHTDQGTSNKWAKITLDKATGYVAAILLDTGGDITTQAPRC